MASNSRSDASHPDISLAERLGYSNDAKLLLISCGNLGCSHASNVAVYEALRSGVATSASLMVPCPWAREAAANYLGETVGVELTVNAPFDNYRWGPLTQTPSLLDGDGGFPRTPQDLWDHADTDEVARECRMQIERAALWGFDVSHLGISRNALVPRPEFFDVYLQLAEEFSLPFRLVGDEHDFGFPFRKIAAEHGVLFPDRVFTLHHSNPAESFEAILADLPAGVTEILIHPSLDTPEQRALDPAWPTAFAEHELASHNAATRELLDSAGVVLIDYGAVRKAQRD